MHRIERLREYVDEILLKMKDVRERRCAYLHLYGVSQACALIALKRNEDVELAVMAGMLHDIYSYACMDKNDHARKGSILASEILDSLQIVTEAEKIIICDAIYKHSDKSDIHDDFTEVLIDADVLQHCLYNPEVEVMAHELERYRKLKLEFGLIL